MAKTVIAKEPSLVIEGYWYVIDFKDKKFSAYLASIDYSDVKNPKYGFIKREELDSSISGVNDIKIWVKRKMILRKARFAQPKYTEMHAKLKEISKTFGLKMSMMFESTKEYHRKIRKEEELAQSKNKQRLPKKTSRSYKAVK
jgi:hypothetical protein